MQVAVVTLKVEGVCSP